MAGLLPSRTPGPLGIKDAADPAVNAELGHTPGSLGVNDGAALLADGRGPRPARSAKTPPQTIRVLPKLKIDLPKTVEIVFEHLENVVGGGLFKIHADGVNDDHIASSKDPAIKVTFNRSEYLYEITSISVFTLKIVNNPNPRALPRVGGNVTNNKNSGTRTPLDDPEGSGYWKDVIKNMQTYRDAAVDYHLQWYARGSTAYHEEVHNQQFRSYIKKNNDSLVEQIEQAIRRDLEGVSLQDLSAERVAKAARSATTTIIAPGTGDEVEAYKKTFAVIWSPEISKIQSYAIAHGWDKE